VDVETMVERARQRDTGWVGSAAAVEQRYRQFRQPVHELYERLASPVAQAHAILDNRNIEQPRLVWTS
jgi:thymidylate kinase